MKTCHVVVTHDHYDHLDYETILRFRTHTNTRFVLPLGVGAHFEKWGFDTTRFCELDWWEKATSELGLDITATPSRHFSGRGLSDRGKTLWTSYVLALDGYKIYLGGDSGYGPHFAEIGQKIGPFDLTILECGQYNYYWRYIHMMPEETVQAHQDLQGKVLWPVHWGKFTLALHPWDEPVTRLLTQAEKQKVVVATPAIGQQWNLQASPPTTRWWLHPELASELLPQ
jgi:L-ascorbate metabolism protein UlaG (beta-lactamase superfamily)